jgi:hypothetical protein
MAGAARDRAGAPSGDGLRRGGTLRGMALKLTRRAIAPARGDVSRAAILVGDAMALGRWSDVPL